MFLLKELGRKGVYQISSYWCNHLPRNAGEILSLSTPFNTTFNTRGMQQTNHFLFDYQMTF